jgi:hypothetical protein
MFKVGDKVKVLKTEPVVPKMYKVCRERDGEFCSALAGILGYICSSQPVLKYKEGQITYAPESSNGIYVIQTLAEAQRWVEAYSMYNLVIFEVTPLGEDSHNTGDCSGYLCSTFPAVLVGKKIQGSPPEPKFKVGETVMNFKIKEQIAKVVWSKEDEPFTCQSPAHWHYHIVNGGVFDESSLFLASPATPGIAERGSLAIG